MQNIKQTALTKESFFTVHRTGSKTILLFIAGEFQSFTLSKFSKLDNITFSMQGVEYRANLETVSTL